MDWEYCRICDEVMDKAYNLFHTKAEEAPLQLSAVFEYVTNINITENDGLPAEVCYECATRLLNAYQLKRLAEETHHSLKEHFELQRAKERDTFELLERQEEHEFATEIVKEEDSFIELDEIRETSDEEGEWEDITPIAEDDLIHRSLLNETPLVKHVEEWVQAQSTINRNELFRTTPTTPTLLVTAEEQKLQEVHAEESRQSSYVDVEELGMNFDELENGVDFLINKENNTTDGQFRKPIPPVRLTKKAASSSHIQQLASSAPVPSLPKNFHTQIEPYRSSAPACQSKAISVPELR